VALEDGKAGGLDIEVGFDDLNGELPEAVACREKVGRRQHGDADDDRHQVLTAELGREVPALRDGLARVPRVRDQDEALGAARARLRVGGVRRHRTEAGGHQTVEEPDLGNQDLAVVAEGEGGGLGRHDRHVVADRRL
jgi:hypothetical protein